MTIRINLLPPEARLPQWHYVRLLMIPVAIMLMIVGGFYGYGEYRSWDMDQQIAETHSRYDALTQAEQQMQLAQSRQVALQARQKILTQLNTGRKSWHGIMSYLGDFMPRKVWLTEIGSAQNGLLQMKGNAISYPDLVAFLGKMEQDSTFAETTLLKAEQNEKDPLAKFEIVVKVRGW
jgi:Tfp pilus assembly protein PilN